MLSAKLLSTVTLVLVLASAAPALAGRSLSARAVAEHADTKKPALDHAAVKPVSKEPAVKKPASNATKKPAPKVATKPKGPRAGVAPGQGYLCVSDTQCPTMVAYQDAYFRGSKPSVLGWSFNYKSLVAASSGTAPLFTMLPDGKVRYGGGNSTASGEEMTLAVNTGDQGFWFVGKDRLEDRDSSDFAILCSNKGGNFKCGRSHLYVCGESLNLYRDEPPKVAQPDCKMTKLKWIPVDPKNVGTKN